MAYTLSATVFVWILHDGVEGQEVFGVDKLKAKDTQNTASDQEIVAKLLLYKSHAFFQMTANSMILRIPFTLCL